MDLADHREGRRKESRVNNHVEMEAHAGGAKAKRITVVGFGPRLIATVLDAVILGFFTFVVGAIVGVVAALLDLYTPNRQIPIEGLLIVSLLALSVLYYVRAWTDSGQTMGKMVLGLRVVGSDGQPLSAGRALLRYLGYLVSGLLLSLGFLWIVFDRKRQGWHDKMAASYVVESDAKFTAGDRVELIPSDPKPGWIWVIVWLVVALIMPAALLGGLFIVGPILAALLTDLLRSLA
jgi:uncharacterized RDD family membrane protein YckC